jgi:hypothetical protein
METGAAACGCAPVSTSFLPQARQNWAMAGTAAWQ